MSARLPPYSTFRTDKKQSMIPQAVSIGNILTFTPRGFKQTLNVKFPDSRLAVCEKCKKNYKTKDSCRVRSGHSTEPWTTAFICVTLDDSCTDSDGKYVDSPLTVRMINWQPYCVKENFDSKTPVCAACKKTNRTKYFCRVRYKHRKMPWCTVFVILSTVDSTDPSTVVASPSIPVDVYEHNPYPNVPGLSRPKRNHDHCQTDDINAVEPSRTFLAQISCTHSSIHWLQYNNGEGSVSNGASESDVKALNEAIRTPGAGDPPPIMDANAQYYQMTQQVMQHVDTVGLWPYSHPMMPVPMMPMHHSQQAFTHDPGGEGKHNPIGFLDNSCPSHETENEKEDPKGETAQEHIDPNEAYHQHHAWTAQMMYQHQVYQHQMYAHRQYFDQKPIDSEGVYQEAPNSPQFHPPAPSPQQYNPVPMSLPGTKDIPHSSSFTLPQLPQAFLNPNEGLNDLSHDAYSNPQGAITCGDKSIDAEVKVGDDDLIPDNFFADPYSPTNELKRNSDLDKHIFESSEPPVIQKRSRLD